MNDLTPTSPPVQPNRHGATQLDCSPNQPGNIDLTLTEGSIAELLSQEDALRFSRSGGACFACGTRKAAEEFDFFFQINGDGWYATAKAACRDCRDRRRAFV